MIIEIICLLCHGSGAALPVGLFCQECGAPVAELRNDFTIDETTKIASRYHVVSNMVSSVFPCGHKKGAKSFSVPCVCHGNGKLAVTIAGPDILPHRFKLD